MEAKVASTSGDPVEDRNVHSATTVMDHSPLAGGRKRLRTATRGEGMATPTGPVGSAPPGAEEPGGAKRRRSSRLSAPHVTHLSRNFENWSGPWRKEALTKGERLWIDRMRRAEDQHSAARRISVSRWTYQKLEESQDKGGKVKLTPFEWCRIMRRRAKKSQAEVAREMNSDRVSVHYMEIGMLPYDELLWFWEH